MSEHTGECSTALLHLRTVRLVSLAGSVLSSAGRLSRGAAIHCGKTAGRPQFSRTVFAGSNSRHRRADPSASAPFATTCVRCFAARLLQNHCRKSLFRKTRNPRPAVFQGVEGSATGGGGGNRTPASLHETHCGTREFAIGGPAVTTGVTISGRSTPCPLQNPIRAVRTTIDATGQV
jgi:hypothetical protein